MATTTKRTISVEADVDRILDAQDSPSRYISELLRVHAETWREAHDILVRRGWRGAELLAAGDALTGTHIKRATGHRLVWIPDALHAFAQRGELARHGVDPARWLQRCDRLANDEEECHLLRALVTELILGNSEARSVIGHSLDLRSVWGSLGREQRQLAGVLALHGPATSRDVAMLLKGHGLPFPHARVEQELRRLAAAGAASEEDGRWTSHSLLRGLALDNEDLIVTQGVDSDVGPADPNGVFAAACELVARARPLLLASEVRVGEPFVNGQQGYVWCTEYRQVTAFLNFGRIKGSVVLRDHLGGPGREIGQGVLVYDFGGRRFRTVDANAPLAEAFADALNAEMKRLAG